MRKTLSYLLMIAFMFWISPSSLAGKLEGPSAWATAEVAEAISLGFVPEHLQGDYTEPISRAGFAEVAVSFVAFQYGYSHSITDSCTNLFNDYCDLHLVPGTETAYDKASLFSLTGENLSWVSKASWETLLVQSDPAVSAFSDARFGMDSYNSPVHEINIAYFLGIVQGYGDGTFNPDGLITRQEAATMLARTYRAYDGELSASNQLHYSDAADISDWALTAVSQITSLGVMQGVGEGAFNPLGNYTVEQCIVTFLRLYKEAKTSRIKGTLRSLRSIEDSRLTIVDRELNFPTKNILFEQETSGYLVVYGYGSGFMPRPGDNANFLFVLDKFGGYRQLYVPAQRGLCSLDSDTNILTISITYSDSPDEVTVYAVNLLTGAIL